MSSLADQPAPDAAAVAARVEELYAQHAALVRSVCRALLRDPVEEEDALQQTFLSAQRALLNGSSPREPAAWLATIARHECYARVHARMREPLPVESEEEAVGPDVHAAAVRRHDAGELRDALSDLPAQQRAAILLREVRGLSYHEVAVALSVTTGAVESLIFRARRTLQTRLREASAALSPAGWAQPVRELLARLAGGGLAGPTAAKVAALGVGTAVATGGALSGPTVLGLGHAPAPAVQTSPREAHRAAPRHSPAAHVLTLPRVASAPPPVRVAVDRGPQHRARPADDVSSERSKPSEASGVSRSAAPERSDDAATSGSGGSGSSSAPAEVSSDDGATQHETSASSDVPATGASDGSSTDTGSPQVGTTTTDSGSSDN